MSKFANLRTPQSISDKNLNESALAYSNLVELQSKIGEIAKKIGGNPDIDSKIMQKISVVSDYVNDVEEKIDNPLHEEQTCDKIVGVLLSVINENSPAIFELNDGNTKEISLELAKTISYVHDELNEENQEKLKILLSDSEDSFNVALNFCESYTAE